MLGWGGVTLHSSFPRDDIEAGADIRVAPAVWWPFRRGRSIPLRLCPALRRRVCSDAVRLAHVLTRIRPDIIHSLGMHRAGYLTAEAMAPLPLAQRPRWIYSCWGSDLFCTGRMPEHAERTRRVMAAVDYLVTDCRRDLDLASDFGFRGTVLGVWPGGGGYDLEAVEKRRARVRPSHRRTIALKGYHDLAGRALVALEAVHRCADVLAGYEVALYSASDRVRCVAERVAQVTGLALRVVPRVPHADMLDLMAASRVAIAASVSDGTPNSMLEAMLHGAFPIQSDVGSTREWIEHGVNGFLVPAEDTSAIEGALREALRRDDLVDRAADVNARMGAERLDRRRVQTGVLDMYRRVLAP